MRFTSLLGLLFLVACDSSNPSPDGGTDGGTCGAAPIGKPACRAECDYVCGHQCVDICGAQGCWTCTDGGWQLTAVDCQTPCP